MMIAVSHNICAMSSQERKLVLPITIVLYCCDLTLRDATTGYMVEKSFLTTSSQVEKMHGFQIYSLLSSNGK